MFTRILCLGVLAATGLPAGTMNEVAVPEDEPRIVEVRMVDKSPTEFVFEPSDVTVRPGEVIRFVQTGRMPHNVQFTDVPPDASFGASLTMGPYLTSRGETYEIVIDDRFAPGTYGYVCTPHAAMGMTGTITVVAEAN